MGENHLASSHPDTRLFWDQQFTGENSSTFDRSLVDVQHGVTDRFWQLLGDVEGKRALDIGCGLGQLAVLLAKRGAFVDATDVSTAAVERTRENVRRYRVEDRVVVREIDALDLCSLGATYDFVVGRFILHHIEPFDKFVEVLDNLLAPGGRGVFVENNSRNRVLMFARKYASGRFGVPKHGDDQEHPLEPGEVAMLAERFAHVQQVYPRFVFFRKLNTYIFRHKPIFKPFLLSTIWLDETLHRVCPFLHKYSYEQLVEVRKEPVA
jgi:SAM-dependent methyltransferase